MADRLSVLLINDDEEPLETLDVLLEIDHARDPEDAQRYLLKSLATGRPYDIIACDVNLVESRTVGDFLHATGLEPSIVPLGPILALPFLSSESTIFVPYSSYWSQIGKKPDIMLVAAFGMIEARAEKKELLLSEIADRLRKFAEEREESSDRFPGSFHTALSRGLRLYRESLFREPSRLLNLGWLTDRLDAVIKENAWPPLPFEQAMAELQCGVPPDPDAPPVQTLLRDNEGAFALTVGRVRRSRTISLASLYADYFLASLNPSDVTVTASSDSIYTNAVLAITNDLDEAAKKLPGGSMPNFTAEVAATLLETDQDGDRWRAGDTLNAVLHRRRRERAKRFPDVEDGAFIRACVLGAWVHAWRLHYDGNMPLSRLRPTVKRLLGIGPVNREDKSDGTINYRRLFIIEGSNNPKRDARGEVSWAAPFRPEKTNLDRWSLDTDEKAELTPNDRSFCEAYAALSADEGGLDWTIGADGDQAPIWMTTLA